jgi:hypothetical protein
VIVLVHEVTPDKVLPRIEQFGGDVIQTSLDEESETRLREALEAPQATSATAQRTRGTNATATHVEPPQRSHRRAGSDRVS